MQDPQVRVSNIDVMSVTSLKPHPDNMNVHTSEQIERLAKIIEYQGWRYPIKVSRRSGFITSGHARLEAAKLRGWKMAPVSMQDYDDDAQEYADLVSDNAIAEWADLNLSSINKKVPEFGPDFDVDLLGIKGFEIEFAPGTEDEQGQLDEKQMDFRLCPNCGEKFEIGQARKIET